MKYSSRGTVAYVERRREETGKVTIVLAAATGGNRVKVMQRIRIVLYKGRGKVSYYLSVE